MLAEIKAEFEQRLDVWIRRQIEGGGTGYPVGLMTNATAIYFEPKPMTMADITAVRKLIENQPYGPDLTYFLPECARQARRD